MSENVDISELLNYLQGQMDMGDFEVPLDDPWTLEIRTRRPNLPPRPPIRPAYVPPSEPYVQPAPMESLLGGAPAAQPAAPTPQPIVGGSTPSPRPVKKVQSAYESAESLSAFNQSLSQDPVYANGAELVSYAGPEHPQVLLLLPSPQPQESAGNFFQTPVGDMLSKMFASLGISTDVMGVSYFYKGRGAFRSTPLLDAALRKMLTKELSFVAPQIMVTFGEPLFHQVFGKGKNFEAEAGAPQEFAQVKTMALVDPYAMQNDKQLKWLTWKVHIPKSGFFPAGK